MTIEIKQLVIRAVVEPSLRPSPVLGASVTNLSPAQLPPPPTPHPAAAEERREAIVAACVREVLRKLERARER